MRFYIPGDITDFILGIRSGHNNQESLNEVLKYGSEDMIFFDGETDRFSPLKTLDNRYEYTDYVLYNLLTLDFKGKNVYYVTGDFNIHSNIDRFKKELQVDIKTDLKPIIYPEVCIPQFLRNTRDRNRSYELDLDFKYNVISLNCTRKHHRIDILRA